MMQRIVIRLILIFTICLTEITTIGESITSVEREERREGNHTNGNSFYIIEKVDESFIGNTESMKKKNKNEISNLLSVLQNGLSNTSHAMLNIPLSKYPSIGEPSKEFNTGDRPLNTTSQLDKDRIMDVELGFNTFNNDSHSANSESILSANNHKSGPSLVPPGPSIVLTDTSVNSISSSKNFSGIQNESDPSLNSNESQVTNNSHIGVVATSSLTSQTQKESTISTSEELLSSSLISGNGNSSMDDGKINNVSDSIPNKKVVTGYKGKSLINANSNVGEGDGFIFLTNLFSGNLQTERDATPNGKYHRYNINVLYEEVPDDR